MDKIKDKYEIILGFVTLVISLGAYKDELKEINFNLGFINLSVSEYSFGVISGLALCAYIYTIENFSRDTQISHWKIFDWGIRFAHFLFIFLLITPILIICIIALVKLFNGIDQIQLFYTSDNYSYLDNASSSYTGDSLRKLSLVGIISTILGTIASLIASLIVSKMILKLKQSQILLKAEEKEIKEIEVARRLLESGYYSHSILSSFKTLEMYIYSNLNKTKIRTPRHLTPIVIQMALAENIIKKSDVNIINEIRSMRNVSAHLNSDHTKKQAEQALEFVKSLLEKNIQKEDEK